MTTEFEALAAEEQIGAETAGQPEPSRPAPGRIVGLVLGSITLSLAATALALRMVRGRQPARGRRRVPAINIQPRVAVLAPTLTISLPFSGIVGQGAPAGRGGRSRVGREKRAGFGRAKLQVFQRRRVARQHGRGMRMRRFFGSK